MDEQTHPTSAAGPVPTRTKTVSGREVRWYRIPFDHVLKQSPSRTSRVEAKIERFSDTLWIVRIVEAVGAGSTKDMPSLEAAEAYWTKWMERRTERRW
jgi:hypothetical protein